MMIICLRMSIFTSKGTSLRSEISSNSGSIVSFKVTSASRNLSYLMFRRSIRVSMFRLAVWSSFKDLACIGLLIVI